MRKIPASINAQFNALFMPEICRRNANQSAGSLTNKIAVRRILSTLKYFEDYNLSLSKRSVDPAHRGRPAISGRENSHFRTEIPPDTACCGSFLLDSQGEFLYSQLLKKRLLITQTQP